MKPLFLALLFGFCLPPILFAQTALNYRIGSGNAALTALPQSTQIIGAGQTNQTRNGIAIPFEFVFMGVRYTNLQVSSNGVVRFGNFVDDLTERHFATAGKALIAPLACQDDNGSWRTHPQTGKVHWQVTDGRLVIEWKDMLLGDTDQPSTFQLHLTANCACDVGQPSFQNSFRFVYGNINLGFDAQKIRIGFGTDLSNGNFQGINPQTLASYTTDANLDVAVPKGTVNSLIGKEVGFKALSDDKLCSCPILSVKCQANALELQWADPEAVVGYVLYRSTDNINFTFLTQTTNKTYTDTQVQRGRTYYYRLYKNTEGCFCPLCPQAQQQVTYQPLPATKFGTTQTICPEERARLTAPKGFQKYLWNELQTGKTATDSTFTTNVAGKIVLTVTNAAGCSATDTFTVAYNQVPELKIGGNNLVCNGEALLEATEGFKKYVWKNAKGEIVEQSNQNSFSATEEGSYSLEAYFTETGCIAKAQTEVIDCCEPILVVPNAFTPHSTAANNLFRVKHENLKKFSMIIYNRWGTPVFQTEDPEQGWNGTIAGSPAQSDAYQAVIEYVGCKDGKTVREKVMQVINLME